MFGFGKKRFLGVDVGTSSIKIVELELNGNKPFLSNYGWVRLEEPVKENNAVSLWERYVSRIIKEGKIKSKDAYVSVPSVGSLITLIDFLEMEREDMDQAIRFEAHKYVPVPLEEVVLSWDVVNSSENKESRLENIKAEEEQIQRPADSLKQGEQQEKMLPSKKVQVLLVAAPKNKVEKYEEMVTGVGLNLKSMEIESFSMVRSLVGNDQGNVIIVDIGARTCNIILTEKGTIKANRNIYSGGVDVTKIIARSLNVEEARAEKLKVSGDNFLLGELAMTFPSLEIILSETKRMVEGFQRKNEKKKIDSLIISGGSANLKGIAEYFQNSLGIKTIIGNPLSRVEYPHVLNDKLNELKPCFSVAIGLALKGIEESFRK